MIVKICGMCNSENLNELVQLNVDWVGMIFYDASSRHAEADKVAAENLRLLRISDFGIKKVGVFVNADESAILQKVKGYNLSYVQLHGGESADFCVQLKSKGLSIIKAFSVDDDFDFDQLVPYVPYCEYFLFDTKGLLPGGNGITFNWKNLAKYNLEIPFILSGGIGMEQLVDLNYFNHSKLAGIDLNSKFESSPGVKDINKLKKFISKFRSKTSLN